jgi:hypothetical protein
MSKQLYEEALAEVRQIKQLAEDNAKKAVMDEVMPRIKEMIESQLIGETKTQDDQLLHDDDVAKNETSEDAETKVESIQEFKSLVNGIEKQIKSLPIRKGSAFKYHKNNLLEALKSTYVLLRETVGESQVRFDLEETIDQQYKTLIALQEKKSMGSRKLQEASLTLKINGLPDDLDDDALGQLDIEILGDEEEVGAGDEEAEESPEAEAGEESSGDELDLDLGGEESSDEEKPAGEEEEKKETKQEGRRMNGLAMLTDDTVVEIDEGMLRREIARMKSLREGKVEGKSAVGKKMTPGVLSAFGGGHDEGDAWLDGKVTTEGLDGMDELDEMEKAPVEEYGMDEDDAVEADGMSELDELVDELATDEGMPHMDEDDMQSDASKSEPASADSEDDEEDDEDEEDEAHMDEAEVEEGPTKKVPSEMDMHPAVQSNRQPNLPESHRKLGRVLEVRKTAALKAKKAQRVMEAARKVGNKAAFVNAKKVYAEAAATYTRATKAAKDLSESIKRSSNSRVVAETATLRKQLAETNLFNAKLLYTNKLLQNESLTPRQKVAVIEKLDEARSLREAKLVYESLTRTMSSGKDRVNEGADRQVLGSASRATRPASTMSLNEGIEASRWAKLAGIVK